MNYKRIILLLIMICLFSLVSFAALDLKWVTEVKINHINPKAGMELAIYATFRTWGGPAQGFRVIGGIDSNTILDKTYGQTAQGQNINVDFSWKAELGNHKAWFQLDPDNTSGDTNPANNRIELNLPLTETAYPNLEITSVKYDPKSCIKNLKMTFRTTVSSIGDLPSGPFVLRMLVDGVKEKDVNIGSMMNVSSLTIEFEWQVKCKAKVEFVADATNQSAESNEADNSWSRIMKCYMAYIGYPVEYKKP